MVEADALDTGYRREPSYGTPQHSPYHFYSLH